MRAIFCKPRRETEIRKGGMPLPSWCRLLAIALLGLPIPASDAHPLPQPQDLIELFDGKIIRGTLQQIGPEGNLLGPGIPPNLNLNDVARLQLPGRESTDPWPIVVHLVNGSQLRSDRIRLEAETLEIRTIFGNQRIPLKLLRGVIWKSSPAVEQLLSQPETASDSAVVQTEEGDRTIQGMVEGISGEQLSIQFQNQSRKISLSRLQAIVMADLGWELSGDGIAVVKLVDGSIGCGKPLAVEEGTLLLEIDPGVRWSIPWNQVGEISLRSDRLVFLSDLEPVSVQQQTLFVLQRTWQRDRSILGNRLVLRTPQQELVEFNRGLGTQAYTRLDFANQNDYRRLLATVGIAAESNGQGDCQMVVQGDGQELWSGRLRGSDPPQEIDVDITGKGTVSLIVHPGEEYDLADHANWCDARFVK